jgi:predicted DNA-binding protein (MmcQ/YjbR family)
MTPEQLQAACLALPDAVETFPFGPEVSVFRHEGNQKLFALTYLDREPLVVSVKCDPDQGDALRQAFASIIPGYHLNKKHWITITIGGDAEDELVGDLIADSYDLIKPKPPRVRKTA